MGKLLIKGARIICPFNGLDQVGDLLLERGKIAKIADKLDILGAEIIDGKGKCVSPGFLDVHVHLREPGREDEETIASGRMSALRGGFTAICCMPNTQPPVDNPTVVEEIVKKASVGQGADVFPVGAITLGRKGKALAELGNMYASAGKVRAFSDDGRGLQDAGLMRRALEYVKMFDGVIVSHCEDSNLSGEGQMHEGMRSFQLGLRGYPSVAEEVMVARDIVLTEYTGSRLHLAHLSSARSVGILREARKRKVRVTAEVTPHHLFFVDEDVDGLDANFKVNPPLRGQADREALRRALAEGVISVIASDHAPHSLEEKEQEFDYAPFGVIGMETAFAAAYTAMVKTGLMTLYQLLERFTVGPAEVMGLRPEEYGEGIREGARADLVILDPDETWMVDATSFASKSSNCPFQGMELTGKVVQVIKNGRLVG